MPNWVLYEKKKNKEIKNRERTASLKTIVNYLQVNQGRAKLCKETFGHLNLKMDQKKSLFEIGSHLLLFNS